jgi:uncharacterized protein (DUF983 family)
LYLGRGYSFPVALEGALKLKEISYIHAEGYPAAEMKHGPIALIDEEMPVFVIATKGTSYEKVVSNIQEVKARKGKIIAIVTEGDTQVKEMADYTIEIPETDEILVPLVSVVPLQLLSYHIAVMRGCNVDQQFYRIRYNSKLNSIITCKCPRCRQGNLFVEKNPWVYSTMLTMPDNCPVCNQDFKIEPGFYIGALWTSYPIVVVFGIILFLILNFVFPTHFFSNCIYNCNKFNCFATCYYALG